MKHLIFDIMYRDGCNFKDIGHDVFFNDINISPDELKEKLSVKGKWGEPIMVQDLGIESCAAIDNEFLMAHNEYDHSYCEIVGISEEILDKKSDKSISDLIEKLNSNNNEADLRKEEAREIINSHLESL